MEIKMQIGAFTARRWGKALSVALLAVAGGAFAQSGPPAGPALDVARYSADSSLQFPPDTESWVFLGADIGGDYAPGRFDPAAPGLIGVVQIEPSAYRYLLEHGRYADGTMLLLSFYEPQQNPDPALRGFVQGDLVRREIHVIDGRKQPDGHAFFMFTADGRTAAMIPPGNQCLQCHNAHGKLQGTFAQFYPPIRRLVPAP
jgi:hypothetical protein